eukprot:COSAG01_NODE_1272_length_10952_cov_8.029301_2_plen_94_part_00
MLLVQVGRQDTHVGIVIDTTAIHGITEEPMDGLPIEVTAYECVSCQTLQQAIMLAHFSTYRARPHACCSLKVVAITLIECVRTCRRPAPTQRQ